MAAIARLSSFSPAGGATRVGVSALLCYHSRVLVQVWILSAGKWHGVVLPAETQVGRPLRLRLLPLLPLPTCPGQATRACRRLERGQCR
jgi:hypothetical protein